MRFALLGPVKVWRGAESVHIDRAQRRAVLAYLLLNNNHAVSSGQLVDALWADQPPETARTQVYSAVSFIRRTLRTAGEDLITSEPGGYRIAVSADQLDLTRFHEAVAEAQKAVGDNMAEHAAGLLRSALSLWDGAALAGISAAFAGPARAHLQEQYLAAFEMLTELELELGHQHDLVPALTAQVNANPMREKLVGQLMLALFRSARQADALAAYSQLRRQLNDELGIDPSAELKQLHQNMLLNNPAIATQAVKIGRSSRRRFLPRDIPDFTGRVSYLSLLDRLAAGSRSVSGAVVISSIVGTGGVGKTALAVHWAHRVRSSYPDGQLYVDLHGYDPQSPLSTAEALGVLLRTLDVPPERIPVDVDEATALYRGVLAGERVLILLDNASSVDQVRPLLPTGAGSLALVTSRDALGGLTARDGARRLTLDVLTDGEALELLANMIGPELVAAESVAAQQLIVLCGKLPLALRIAAANIILRPERGLTGLVTELSNDRLRGLAVDGDLDFAVSAVFGQSYKTLSSDTCRAFRLLGLIPGADFTADGVAALCGITVEEALARLRQLSQAHLVGEVAPHRYALHDLVKAYAVEQAEREDAESTRDMAARRFLTHLWREANAAASVIAPQMVRLPESEVDMRHAFDDRTAMAWFRREQANLLAAIRSAAAGQHGQFAWRLADAMRGYFWLCRDMGSWLDAARTGLAAATALNDSLGKAAMQLSLGTASRAMGRLSEAVEHSGAAQSLARDCGWSEGLTSAITSRAVAHAETGEMQAAIEQFEAALTIHRARGRTGSIAVNLTNIGGVRLDIGDLRSAADDSVEALRLYQLTHNRAGAGNVHGNLGIIYLHMGRWDEALEHLRQALEVQRELGDRSGEAVSLLAQAEISRYQGQTALARDQLLHAQRIAQEISDQRTEISIRISLGIVYHQSGQTAASQESLTRALIAATHSGHQLLQADALIAMAGLSLSEGEMPRARELAEQALEICRAVGYQIQALKALVTLAEVSLAQGSPAAARDAAAEALELTELTGYALATARVHEVLRSV